MRCISLFIATALFAVVSHAQTLMSSADCSIQLNIKGGGGTNGMAVAYNPIAKFYYAVFAGNASYPMEIFDSKGKYIKTQEVGFDARGFWYQPLTKSLDGILYDNNGTFSLELSSSGMIGQSKTGNFSYGADGNAVFTYNPVFKKALNITENLEAHIYTPNTAKKEVVKLKAENYMGDLNVNGPVFTAVKGKEIGLLDGNTMTMYFFDIKTGKSTGKVKLNVGNCLNAEEFYGPTYFRVSYANDKVWIFDADLRMWMGFTIWAN